MLARLLAEIRDLLKRGSRRKRMEGWEGVRLDLVKEIVSFFPDQPWWYNFSPSFLQRNKFPEEVVSAALYFPYLPSEDSGNGFFIDIVGPEYFDDYQDAEEYLTRAEWERRREVYLHKTATFGKYFFLHFIAHPGTTRNPEYLRKLLTSVLGK